MPILATEQERLQSCKAFASADKVSNMYTCEFEDLEGYSSFTVILVFIAVVMVLIFSIAIIYYNIYVLIMF